jgi:outer membrane protein OmpA-like peptidoglycan-associated protein
MLTAALLLGMFARCIAAEGDGQTGAVQGLFDKHAKPGGAAPAPSAAPPGSLIKAASGAILQEIQEKGFATVHIQFAVNSDVIEEASRSQVEDIRQALQEQAALCLRIAGHTDSTGDSAYNRELSLRRSRSILSALTGMGISEKRLLAEGYGSDQPVADNKSAEGRLKNRRVELHKMECPSN